MRTGMKPLAVGYILDTLFLIGLIGQATTPQPQAVAKPLTLSQADIDQACQAANEHLGPAYASRPEPCEFKPESPISGVATIYIGGKQKFDPLEYELSDPVVYGVTHMVPHIHVSKVNGTWQTTPEVGGSNDGLTEWDD
jgi:hypothetical protein